MILFMKRNPKNIAKKVFFRKSQAEKIKNVFYRAKK